ncbi:hypothetical protein ACU8OG_26610 (plasmid) [Rhizobium leguminosarum]
MPLFRQVHELQASVVPPICRAGFTGSFPQSKTTMLGSNGKSGVTGTGLPSNSSNIGHLIVFQTVLAFYQ